MLLATPDANAGRLSGHAQRLLRRIVKSRLGSFGNRGNGRYREELRKGLVAIGRYLATHRLPQERTRLAARWAIWHGSRAFRCGWVRVCDARQRISLARSSADSGAAGTYLPIISNNARKARRCAAETSAPRFRWDPRERPAVWSWPRIRASEEEDPGGRHTCGRRVRALLHQLAATGIYCPRCGRVVAASGGHTRQHVQTKTSSRTRTAGAVIRSLDRNAGK